jgi:hypothetical protein
MFDFFEQKSHNQGQPKYGPLGGGVPGWDHRAEGARYHTTGLNLLALVALVADSGRGVVGGRPN